MYYKFLEAHSLRLMQDFTAAKKHIACLSIHDNSCQVVKTTGH